MGSPLSTANPTPPILISNFLANAVRNRPNSLAAQKQRRLLAFTFLVCPSKNYDRNRHDGTGGLHISRISTFMKIFGTNRHPA